MPASTQVRDTLYNDPIWSAYAIADLQPDFDPYCTWYVGGSGQDLGVALLFTALSIPTLFTVGEPTAVAAAVAKVPLPEEVYITIREFHMAHLTGLYDFSADTRPMWRMTLADEALLPARSTGSVTRLGEADGPRLQALFAGGGEYAPDAFDPYQLQNGVFVGVEMADGSLAAAGGTHIVDWTSGVAAIGNMYTREPQRGRGYGRAILHAIVTILRAGNVQNIVLNVDQRNERARRIYEAYGFSCHCPYLEGIGELRHA